MKTYFSGHFLKYIKVNLMMSNREYEISTSHLLSPNKASSSGTGLYSTELLVDGWPMEIPKQPRLCLRQWVTFCTHSRVLFLKTMPI